MLGDDSFRITPDLKPKIHSLSDGELRNLSANAHRIECDGTPLQRLKAHDLIPAINAELFMRRTPPARNAPAGKRRR